MFVAVGDELDLGHYVEWQRQQSLCGPKLRLEIHIRFYGIDLLTAN